jgi:hypothetical protein
MCRMIELDKRSKYDIQLVIKWATDDSFWQVNILSAGTLRKQYDKLDGNMRRKVVPMPQALVDQPPTNTSQRSDSYGFKRRAVNDLAIQEMLFGKGDST